MELDDLFHKFMEQVESIFKNRLKPLRRRSFLNNDLILLTDIPSFPPDGTSALIAVIGLV
ncbi:hypothetical protein [Desulfotignum phosphitoxidans]|jgi:hypothetical protein|uniref:Uncharacterized protein n=1 Tax=Desulfotignum phosphitoxidans DSM 13687 TaxID=1286635 RepID=S0FRD4_9BACT|nr:hypothetical protein [Desulfotignum phosphitoxidans]EMS77240.1 hypothetical protein Dpo_19c00150 [Desulfotignum phosphitoxidans DSM 13687]